MTPQKTLEKILLKVNIKSNDLYFDFRNLTFEQFERLVKLVKRIFKVKIKMQDMFKCVGIVELMRVVESRYFIKFGRRI